jgi:DeoR family glycerol-3-phosphate regulon repressor
MFVRENAGRASRGRARHTPAMTAADLPPRLQEIVALVRERGLIQLDELAARFAVTPQTIRRDVGELADRALVRRYRGGIAAPSSVRNVAYARRKTLLAAEKARIARACAAQVPDEASLFLNIGTTTGAVAAALTGHRGLRVVTNDLNVANVLHGATDFDLTVAGGTVRRDGGIVGAATAEFLQGFKVDIGIIGISGIDAEGDLLDYDAHEVRVARTIIANSRRVFLVADHTKFGRHATQRLCNVAEIDDLFTDRAPGPAMAAVLAAAGCRVHVAG